MSWQIFASNGTQTWHFNHQRSHHNEWATGNCWSTTTFTNDKELNAIKQHSILPLRGLLHMCRSCAHIIILISKGSAGPYCLELMEQSDPVYSKPSGTVSIAAEYFNFPFHFHDITWPDRRIQKYETHTNVTTSPCQWLASGLTVSALNGCCRRLISIQLRLESLFLITDHYSRDSCKAHV